jgi:hypothetical protein
MVARLEPVKSISKPLSYNDEKVTQGEAELIHLNNFLQSKNRLTYADKIHRFQHFNELNTRSKIKMLYATLNFSPGINSPTGNFPPLRIDIWKAFKWKTNLVSFTSTTTPGIRISISILPFSGPTAAGSIRTACPTACLNPPVKLSNGSFS